MKNKLSILVLSLTAATSFAGSMGPIISPEKLLLVEGGVAYSHAFYKDNALLPDSFTAVTPVGFPIRPSHFYPNKFFGGYAGLSLYTSDWLFNSRYSVYGSKRHANTSAGTIIKLQPVKLAFTADKVWGDINAFSYGLGAGAVIESINSGYSQVNVGANNPPSKSLQGRSQIDPVVEGFLMYRLTNNFGTKFNLEYQIPVNNTFGNGDLNLTWGINYAFPI